MCKLLAEILFSGGTILINKFNKAIDLLRLELAFNREILMANCDIELLSMTAIKRGLIANDLN